MKWRKQTEHASGSKYIYIYIGSLFYGLGSILYYWLTTCVRFTGKGREMELQCPGVAQLIVRCLSYCS
jgi:hypothetical protein